MSNQELRYALSAWDSVLDEVTDGQMFSLDLVRESFVPLLAEKGIEIDRRKIVLDDAIKAVGEYKVEVKLHREVSATLKVVVSAEE